MRDPESPASGLWWEREDLRYQEGRLRLAGRDVERLARSARTPVFLYSGERLRANLLRLRAALESTGLDFRVYYAMKCNRYPPLLSWLKVLGLCGIDACSPGELLLARQCGFEEEEISYTATSVSDADLEVLERHPDTWINCDSLSMLRRLGERCPGRSIGLRVNPAMGVGYGDNELLRYAGGRTTKFGLYRAQFPEALALARRYGLKVKGIHFHTGCGYLNRQLAAWDEILGECLGFLEQLEAPEFVNLGGGLGLPHVATDRPLDLGAWSEVIRRRLGGRGLRVCVEPGDYLAKDSGVLVLEVNMVERKQDTVFVGVNGGFNLHVEPAFYRLPCEPVPVVLRQGQAPALQRVTLAGNINEALDVWGEGVLLPEVREGDLLALLNAGGYGSAMSSNHCMRGQFSEYLLLPPAALGATR